MEHCLIIMNKKRSIKFLIFFCVFLTLQACSYGAVVLKTSTVDDNVSNPVVSKIKPKFIGERKPIWNNSYTLELYWGKPDTKTILANNKEIWTYEQKTCEIETDTYFILGTIIWFLPLPLHYSVGNKKISYTVENGTITNVCYPKEKETRVGFLLTFFLGNIVNITVPGTKIKGSEYIEDNIENRIRCVFKENSIYICSKCFEPESGCVKKPDKCSLCDGKMMSVAEYNEKFPRYHQREELIIKIEELAKNNRTCCIDFWN